MSNRESQKPRAICVVTVQFRSGVTEKEAIGVRLNSSLFMLKRSFHTLVEGELYVRVISASALSVREFRLSFRFGCS